MKFFPQAIGAKALFLSGMMALAGAQASAEQLEATYTCERGVVIPVVYVNGDDSAVVLWAEGQLITLPQAVSGSGARYALAEGSTYVWWSHGDGGTLAWFDSEKGEEVTLFASCETE